MEAYILDTNGFLLYKKDINLEEQETLNYTIKQMTAGYYKPRFNHDINDWEEGATEEEIEEIKRQEEANRPQQEPNEMEVLEGRVGEIENINAGLLLENAGHQIKIQEQEKMNKEQEVTNANLLLEIAMLKGVML